MTPAEWKARGKRYEKAAEQCYVLEMQYKAEENFDKAAQLACAGWYWERTARRFNWPKPRPFFDEIRGI